MFYLLIFFSIYWCLFPIETEEENSICLSYYNLAEPYGEELFSDVYFISDVNSCRISNVTSQMVSTFPTIEGKQKNLLKKWFNNIINVGEDACIIYLGTWNASRRQKFHFIYVTVSVNEKYIFLMSEYDKQVKSVILGERLNEFPMSGSFTSSLLKVTRHKCIIKFVGVAYDTNMPPESFLIKLRINNGTIKVTPRRERRRGKVSLPPARAAYLPRMLTIRVCSCWRRLLDEQTRAGRMTMLSLSPAYGTTETLTLNKS